MRTIITLCALLLMAATANAQFDLLETPASQAAPSAFDLLHVADPNIADPNIGRASSPMASSAESDFDLLYVAKPKEPEPTVVEAACLCGCNKPNCGCSAIAAGAGACRKPIIRMRSASWCSYCRAAIKDVAEAEDCPFELEIVNDEASQTSLPRFTWEAGGKWYVPLDPQTGKERAGYRGLEDLIAHWRVTQPATVSVAPRLTDAVAASVQRHFAARVQSPPASLGKPGDSGKKRAEPSRSGSTTNASGSAKKSPAPSGPSMAKPLASTRSPGGRS